MDIEEGARAEMRSATTPLERMGAALFLLCYFPTRFAHARLGAGFTIYPRPHARSPRLDLPFSHRDYDGVVFIDR